MSIRTEDPPSCITAPVLPVTPHQSNEVTWELQTELVLLLKRPPRGTRMVCFFKPKGGWCPQQHIYAVRLVAGNCKRLWEGGLLAHLCSAAAPGAVQQLGGFPRH